MINDNYETSKPKKQINSDRITGDSRTSKRKKKALKRVFSVTTSVLAVVLTAALFISSLLFPILMISGDSMEPGLNDGDIILLTKIYSITPGDLICFNWNDKSLLKRVIACPGDWVTIDETGRVYVNGALLDEPYVSEYSLGESDISYPFQVPESSYFVMGDERASSLDSRSSLVGCVKADQIIGEGLLRVRPLGSL